MISYSYLHTQKLTSLLQFILISQILGGYLEHKYGGRIVFGTAVFVSSIVSLLTPTLAKQGPYAFMAARFILGLSQVSDKFLSKSILTSLEINLSKRNKYNPGPNIFSFVFSQILLICDKRTDSFVIFRDRCTQSTMVCGVNGHLHWLDQN